MDFDVAETFPTKELQDQAIGIRSPEPIQACKLDSNKHWRTSGLPYPSPTLLITVFNIAIRRKIKRRDSLLTRSITRHPSSCPVSFLLSA